MQSRCLPLATALLVVLSAAPAYALDFGSSTTTGKGVTSFPFRLRTPDEFPIGAEFGIRVLPGLSDALGPARLNPTYSEAFSSMIDADIAIRGNIPVLKLILGPLGIVQPVVSPFLGYRYLALPTAEYNVNPSNALGAAGLDVGAAASGALSLSQFSGIEYGVKAEVPLPLGFEGHAGLGLTTLTGGGWDTRQFNGNNATSALFSKPTAAGRTDPGGATLPDFTLGASWSGLGVLQLSVGYELFVLPTLIRAQSAKMDGAKTTINNLTIGIRLFSFQI